MGIVEQLNTLREMGISEPDNVLQMLLKQSNYSVEAALNRYFEHGVPKVPDGLSRAKSEPIKSGSEKLPIKRSSSEFAKNDTDGAKKRIVEQPDVTDLCSPEKDKISKTAQETRLYFIGERWLECHSISNRGRVAYKEKVDIYHELAKSSLKQSTNGARGHAGGFWKQRKEEKQRQRIGASVRCRLESSGVEARLPMAIAGFLGPLLQHTLVVLSAETCVELDHVTHFTQIIILVRFHINPRVFELSNHEDPLKTAALQLFQFVHTGNVEEIMPIKENKGKLSEEKKEPEAEVLVVDGEDCGLADSLEDNEKEQRIKAEDAQSLYDSTLQDLPELPDPHGLNGIILRPYQRQALWWMTKREQLAKEEHAIAIGLTSAKGVESLGLSTDPSVREVDGVFEILDSQEEALEIEKSESCMPICNDGSVRIKGKWRGKSGAEGLTMNPLWERRFMAFRDTLGNLSEPRPFYVNLFSWVYQLDFPAEAQPCRGGILADEMGMGKTIELLATILADKDQRDKPPVKKGSRRKRMADGPTLVICPMSMLSQWRQEIEQKTPCLRVHTYYGLERTRSPEVLEESFDVVVTTYGTLASEMKELTRSRIFIHYGEPDAGSASLKAVSNLSKAMAHAEREDLPSPLEKYINTGLYLVRWNRIILDEAHNIKNQSTEIARACYLLHAQRRWAVTGTPLQNSLGDLFSLMRFLQHEPWNDAAWWKKVIQDPYEHGEVGALDRLKSLMSPILLRRTKDMRGGDGKLILELPPKKIHIEYLEFSDAEKVFYKSLFAQTKLTFEGFQSRGQLGNSYAAIFTLLMRLRQACDHPFLVLGRSEPDPSATVEDGDNATKAPRFIRELYRRFEASTAHSKDDSAIASTQYIDSVVKDLQNSNMNTKECPICLDPPVEPVLTPCAHLMCKKCLMDCLAEHRECPVCRKGMTRNDVINIQDDDKSSEQKEKPVPSLSEFTENWQGSTKLNQLERELLAMRQENSSTKAVIFSQWSYMLDLVSVLLKRMNWKYTRLDGAMSQQQRELSLNTFSSDSEVCVFLASLKAGGVGLNLTSASMVFLVDPWWNPAIEDQAIDRVHRLGQNSPVVVKRFIIRDTVEEKMLLLQDKKRRLAQNALKSGKLGETSRVRLEDLVDFFR